MIDLFLLLAPLSSSFGLPPGLFDWVSAFNPFVGLSPLVDEENLALSLSSSGLWLLIGLAGTAVASWRLRPSCLAVADGERVARRQIRRSFVPPVDERRPMVWKELFIEKVATLGRFGSWAGLILVGGLLLVSTGLTAVYVWDVKYRHEVAWADWARAQMTLWIGGTGWLLCCLIEWAIGLRAAVAIASERERGTWDALMTSPLEGREIVRGKLYGSLFAIRWLIVAAILAWALGAAVGALMASDALRWSIEIVVVGAFMAAVGVRMSLACPTATRAMSITIGFWLGAYLAVAVGATILIVVAFLVGNAAWLLASQLGAVPPAAGLWLPPSYIVWPLATNSLYLLATLLIVADTRLRFDRIAGRMTQGRVSVAFDEFLYGRPEEPIPIELADGQGDDDGGRTTGGWVVPVSDQRREDPVSPSA